MNSPRLCDECRGNEVTISIANGRYVTYLCDLCAAEYILSLVSDNDDVRIVHDADSSETMLRLNLI